MPALSRRPVLMQAGHPDSFQTPPSALDPLLPHLPRKALIWEPCCGKGYLVRGLKRAGWPVIGTDILTGHDALSYAPAVWDCAVTNVPFSIRDDFLARFFSLGKPFAFLVPDSVFDSIARRAMFRRYRPQLLVPDGRIHFETPNHEERMKQGKRSASWFMCVWVCWQLGLPADICFA